MIVHQTPLAGRVAAAILVLVGLEMLLAGVAEVEVPTHVSLAVIVLALAVSVIASVLDGARAAR